MAFTFYAVVLASAIGDPSPVNSQSDLAVIGAQASRLPRLIDSIQLRWTETGVGVSRNSAFYADGGKYRSDFSKAGQSGTPTGAEQKIGVLAYNGQMYQDLDADGRILARATKRTLQGNPYGALNPLVLPFVWVLRKGDPWTLESMRNNGVWEQRFTEAKLIGRDRVDGYDCLVVGFPHATNKDCVYKVYLAIELGYFPLQWQRFVEPGDLLTTNAIVTRFKRFTVKDQIASVPLVLEYEEFGKDNVSLPRKCTYRVAEDSLQVNQPISEDVFTISTLRAKRVVDVDDYNRSMQQTKQRAEEMTQERIDSSAHTRASRWRVFTALYVMMALILIVFLVVRRRVSRRAKS